MADGTGMHRNRGLSGRPDTAFVKDRSISFDIIERMYRQRGYLPQFDDLPWQEDPANCPPAPALKPPGPPGKRR
jgi:hypothetical protein